MSLIIGDLQIAFPERTVFNDTVQLTLTIQYGDDLTSPTSYNADEIGLNIKSYGDLLLEYALDEFLLTPANFDIIISDRDGVLADHLFRDDFNIMKATCELKINGSSDFNGSLVDDSITFNEGTKELSLSFSSDSNKINEITLYDADDVAKNPLGLGLERYSSINNNEDETLTKIDIMLGKIFSLVDPNIETTIYHDWLFGGITPGNRPRTFTNIYVENYAWFNNPDNKRLLGELLKNVAKTFFAQAIIPSNSKAYFRKLYYYTSYGLQSVTVLNRIKNYKYHKISYSDARNTFGTTDGTIVFQHPDSSAYTEVIGDYVSYSHIWEAYYMEKSTFVDFEYVYYVNDPLYTGEVQEYYQWQEIISKLMYYYRSKTYFNRVDAFKLKGLDYNYINNFNYDGSKYQILGMRKVLSEGTTDVEALYLGDV